MKATVLPLLGLFAAQFAAAQGQPPAAPQQQQEVVVTATKLGGNVYGIDGQGGRMAALVGPEGVFLVDSQFARVTDKIVAAIAGVSQSPLKFLVNTHVHGDHTGGNENFAKLGVTILGRPNLRAQLLKPRPAPGNGQVPPVAPPAALPIVLFDTPTTVYLNGETVQLVPLHPAHTDGDTAVKFEKADVLMTGDVFRSEGFPAAAITNGGSVLGTIEALEQSHRAVRAEHEGGAGSRARRRPRRARLPSRHGRHRSRPRGAGYYAKARAPTKFAPRSPRRSSSSESAGRRTSSRSSSMGSSRSSAHNAASRRRDHAAPLGLSARRRRAARNARRADSGARPPDSFPQLRTRSGRSSRTSIAIAASSCSAGR